MVNIYLISYLSLWRNRGLLDVNYLFWMLLISFRSKCLRQCSLNPISYVIYNTKWLNQLKMFKLINMNFLAWLKIFLQLELPSVIINVFFLALYIASLKGDNHEVQKLINDGHSVNLTYNSGKSNLVKVLRKYINCFHFLLTSISLQIDKLM